MRLTNYRAWKADRLASWFREGVGEVSWHVVDECALGAGLAVSSEERNRNEQIDEAYVDFLSERMSRLQAIAQGKPITAGFFNGIEVGETAD